MELTLPSCMGAHSATPSAFPTSPPLPLLAIFVLVCWVQPISPLVWRRGRDGYHSFKKKNKKKTNSSHRPLSDTFPPCSLITKLPSNKQTFKTRGFILSIAPSWMLGGNLKMIYANVISLCVIQHSQLMSELPQPNYKLTRLDITARLMCFSGTCLIARRLRWG